MAKDARNSKEVLQDLGESHQQIAMNGGFGFKPVNGKEGQRLGSSKFKLGDMVKFNRPGDRKVFKVVSIETWDGTKYNYEGVAVSGGPRGSHFSSAPESDLRLSDEKVQVSDPKWIPTTGERVIVQHLNFEVEDTVVTIKQENNRWNMYLKSTSPMPGRKTTAFWDGKHWTSGSYGSPMNGFNVVKWENRPLRNDID